MGGSGGGQWWKVRDSGAVVEYHLLEQLVQCAMGST